MAGVGDGLGGDPRVALYPTLQHDVVKADDHGPAGRSRGFEQLRYMIDGDVRPLGLLDLDKDSHLFARRPIDGLFEGRDPGSGKPHIKAGSRVEAANLFESEIGGKAMAVGGAVERAVVKHDRLAFGAQHDVYLDRRRTPGLRRRERRQCVLRVVEAIAAMAADMDAAGLPRQET